MSGVEEYIIQVEYYASDSVMLQLSSASATKKLMSLDTSYRRGPSQDVTYDLIIWYVSKIVYKF